jgi:1-phosphofructokinase family hexose kinase
MAILTVTASPAIDHIMRVARLRPDDPVRATDRTVYAGGKGNNAARALHRLGHAVVATGFAAAQGPWSVPRLLAGEGIETTFVSCREPTRISLIIYDEAADRTYAVYEPAQSVTEDEVVALRTRVRRLLPRVSLCLLAGSVPQGAPATLYADLITLCRRFGVRSLVDTSGDALRYAIDAKPFLVKVNLTELSEYVGYPVQGREELEVLQEIYQRGIDVAVVTRGERGLLMAGHRGVIEAVLPMERVLSTVGCGDAALAGLAAGILEGEDLAGLARWGAACGAANTQALGAGFLDLPLVRDLLPRVRVRTMAV